MKKLIALLAMIGVALGANAQGRFKITGRLFDPNQQPIAYATVVLLNDEGAQIVGTSSTAEGSFELSAARGEYNLTVSFLGFENFQQTVNLTENTNLGNITLTPSSQKIDAVIITEHIIKREADRFIVNVANNPLASNKDAFEMLRTAPGVWVSKSNGITINGQSGTRVMIDDRMLNLSSDDLEAYLRALPASDISRIEVIPSSGAEYDADSSGGIIKIIMVKKRTSGIDGSIGMRVGGGYYGDWHISPSGRINYYRNGLNLYAQAGYTHDAGYNQFNETTDYTDGSRMDATGDNRDRGDRYNAKVGALYDLTPKQSIGAEVGIFYHSDDGPNASTSTLDLGDMHIKNTSFYNNNSASRYLSTSVNYILKLDDKGSTFKLLGDWFGNAGSNNNRYENSADILNAGIPFHLDTLSRQNARSEYNAYALTADFELKHSASRDFKFGAKYTRNTMYSEQYVAGHDGSQWIELPEQSRFTDYNENIAALYGVYNQKFGNIGLSVGLRGEYTAMNPHYTDAQTGQDTTLNKRYWDIFPTVNFSLPFNKMQTHILQLNYSRRISRPGFWALNPRRYQLSEYSYVLGNPDLKPMYSNSIVATYIYKYRYTLSIGAQLQQNEMQQKVMTDPTDPNILMYQHVNIPHTYQYFASANAPFTITDWWSVNINGTFVEQQQQLEETGSNKFNPLGIGNISSTFMLPRKWEIELSFFGMTKIMNANMMIEPMYNLNVEASKRIGKWTLGVSLNNLLQHSMSIHSTGANFDRWSHIINNQGSWMSLGFSVRYNFNSGVKFRNRTVQSGAEDERGRMGQQN